MPCATQAPPSAANVLPSERFKIKRRKRHHLLLYHMSTLVSRHLFSPYSCCLPQHKHGFMDKV